MKFLLSVGTVFRGYCQGYFGRDAYGEKVVEGFGTDWIVVRSRTWDKGSVYFASFSSHEEMLAKAREFAQEKGPED